MNYKIVIPARYGSSRLPGKPLISLKGKTMIQHVWERAVASNAEQVVIATDDKRIQEEAIKFGAEVCMTDPNHENGTERIAEVAKRYNWNDDTIVVNLQGDEPLIPNELIELTAKGLSKNPEAGMSSLCTPIKSAEDGFDPNVVKTVLDKNGFAMYFSRAPIPWDRDLYSQSKESLTQQIDVYRHIGMYGYRVSFLKTYDALAPSVIEQVEKLEQLRALWHGIKIHMGVISEPPGHGIDTMEDVGRVEALL